MELSIEEKENMMMMSPLPARMNKSEKMGMLKDNIQFLQVVKNSGVVTGSDIASDYISFMENGAHKEAIEGWIMDLGKILYTETKSYFKPKK